MRPENQQTYPLKLARLVLILTLIMTLLGVSPVQAAATYTVSINIDDAFAHDSNTSDGICQDMLSRGCTLRAAMEQANASPGSDIITFSHGMAINLNTSVGAMPTLTGQVTIDASSAWDTAQNIPGVTLDGSGYNSNGLFLKAGACQIYGLYITNFQGSAIYVTSASNIIGGSAVGQSNALSGNLTGLMLTGSGAQYNQVQSNFIGTTPNGYFAQGNETGVYIGAGASYNTLGGASLAQGNVISSSTYYGVQIDGASSMGNNLGGNIIGWGIDLVQTLGNGRDGIHVANASDTYIGGGGALAGNYIGNNMHNGIYITTAGGVTNIENNTIDMNVLNGIAIMYTSGVGIINNDISVNGQAGVYISGNASTGNTLMENHITANGGKGIQLSYGANNGRVAPVVASATAAGASGTVTGCANCYIEVFSDFDNEGWTYHGAVSANASGAWSYSGVLTGPNVTATVTDQGGNTSEFSAPRRLLNQKIFLPMIRK